MLYYGILVFLIIFTDTISPVKRKRRPDCQGINCSSESDIPWIADLGRKPRGLLRSWRHRCTGALIDHPFSADVSIMLTSSACAYNLQGSKRPEAMFQNGEKVGINQTYCYGNGFCQLRLLFREEKVFLDAEGDSDDVGALVLAKVLNRQPIPLPRMGKLKELLRLPDDHPEHQPQPIIEDKLYTSGWAWIKRRTYAFSTHQVSVVAPKLCRISMRYKNNDFWQSSSLCVIERGPESVETLCRGGCPLYMNISDTYILLGVYNGLNMGHKRAMFFNVKYHLPKLRRWIEEIGSGRVRRASKYQCKMH